MSRSVGITLDKERSLRYNINALADLEEITGLNIGEIALSGGMSIRIMRALLWAGLRHESKDLTLREAGNLLQKFMDNKGDFNELGEKILEAMKASGLITEDKEPEGKAEGTKENQDQHSPDSD